MDDNKQLSYVITEIYFKLHTSNTGSGLLMSINVVCDQRIFQRSLDKSV